MRIAAAVITDKRAPLPTQHPDHPDIVKLHGYKPGSRTLGTAAYRALHWPSIGKMKKSGDLSALLWDSTIGCAGRLTAQLDFGDCTVRSDRRCFGPSLKLPTPSYFRRDTATARTVACSLTRADICRFHCTGSHVSSLKTALSTIASCRSSGCCPR